MAKKTLLQGHKKHLDKAYNVVYINKIHTPGLIFKVPSLTWHLNLAMVFICRKFGIGHAIHKTWYCSLHIQDLRFKVPPWLYTSIKQGFSYAVNNLSVHGFTLYKKKRLSINMIKCTKKRLLLLKRSIQNTETNKKKHRNKSEV